MYTHVIAPSEEYILRKEAQDWLDSSDYDFETSKIMFETGRYSYCVFMCHQTVEKLEIS